MGRCISTFSALPCGTWRPASARCGPGYALADFCAAITAEYARTEQVQRADGLIAVRGGQPAGPVAVAGPGPTQPLRTAQ